MHAFLLILVSLAWVTAAAAAETATRANAAQAPLSEAAVQKAVADYKKTADEITSGRASKVIHEPFKPAVLPVEKQMAAEITVENKPAPAANAVANVAVAATVKSPMIARYAKEADQARAQGNWNAAIRTWNDAEKEARTTGDRGALAQAALQQARLLQAIPAPDAATQRGRQEEIIAKYQTAVEALPRPEQAFARNNLAVAFLQAETPAAARTAADVMREVDWKTVDPEQLALCRYNFGRAEEIAGNVAAAVRQYRMALEREPDFAPAVEALFRVLTRSNDAAQIAEVGTDLVRRNEAVAVLPRLRDALVALAATEKADAILVAWARACAEVMVAPAEYVQAHAKPLATAAGKSPALRGLVAEVGRAFAGDLPMDFGGHRVRSTLPSWSVNAARQQAMSRLLQRLGDGHSRPAGGRGTRDRGSAEALARAKLALVSYVAAWALDRGNTDAPVYAAAVLQEHRELDADGALLGTLVNQLFQQKGEAIGIRVKSTDDMRNLMRLHLVLGTIFEREKKWGPKWDPRSAAFQLSHAIALEEELRKADPTFVASADLYARAGRAYAEASEPALALEFHTKAAEAYLHFRDASKARLSCDAALALPNARGSEYQARLDGVAARLEQL